MGHFWPLPRCILHGPTGPAHPFGSHKPSEIDPTGVVSSKGDLRCNGENRGPAHTGPAAWQVETPGSANTLGISKWGHARGGTHTGDINMGRTRPS